MRVSGALALLACAACAACSAGSPPPPASAPVVATPAPASPVPDDQACRSELEQARALANEGDRVARRDIERALESYERAAELYPRDPHILWKLALAYEKKEDWAKETAVLERAVELMPERSTFWFKLGFAWIQRAEAGDRDAYSRAIGPLERCLERDPNFSECHFLLGEASEWTGDDGSALVAYSQAIQRDPQRGYFYPFLAELYLALRFQEQAEAVLNEGVRLVPKSEGDAASLSSIYLLLARIAQQKGDRAALVSALESAEKYLNERHPEHLFSLGSAYATATPPDKKQAIRLLMQFTKLVCRGSAAAKFKEQCEESASLLQGLGQ